MIYLFGSARLGRDVELRYTPNGDAVCNLSLAFSYGKKDESGHRPTTWVDAALWGRRAEALAPYLVKGMQVTVTVEEVHLEYFKSQDGTERPKLAGRVSDLDLGASPPVERDAPGRPAPAPARAAPPRMPARAAPAGGGQSGFDDFDSDIPF